MSDISIIFDTKLKLLNPSSEVFTVGDVWTIDEKGVKCRAQFFKHFSVDELRHSIQDLQYEIRKREGMRINGKIISLKKSGDKIYRDKWSINNSKLITENEEDKDNDKKARAPRVPPTEKRRLVLEYYGENGKFPSKDVVYKDVPIGKYFDKLSTDGKSLIELYTTVGAELPK